MCFVSWPGEEHLTHLQSCQLMAFFAELNNTICCSTLALSLCHTRYKIKRDICFVHIEDQRVFAATFVEVLNCSARQSTSSNTVCKKMRLLKKILSVTNNNNAVLLQRLNVRA